MSCKAQRTIGSLSVHHISGGAISLVSGSISAIGLRWVRSSDAWWIEPVRRGEFRIDQSFLDVPNVIASPHNSAQSEGAHDTSLRRAVENRLAEERGFFSQRGQAGDSA
jgi:phosphoglycerate dehydrogenase-like enzyme